MEDKKPDDKISIGGIKFPVKAVIAIGMVGILLVAISGFWGETTTTDPSPAVSYEDEMTQYIAQTEQRIEELLSSVAEVGKSKIMLTLESGNEYIYAKDEKLSTNTPNQITESRYILVGGTGGQQALVLRQLSPKIKGVVVVCQGGDNPLVKEKVSEVISTALGISYLQISVQKLAV